MSNKTHVSGDDRVLIGCLSSLVESATAEEVIKYYEDHNKDINYLLNKKMPMNIFPMMTALNFKQAKQFETGFIDLSKHDTLTTELIFTGDY